MHQLPKQQLLSLLVHAYNNCIKDYYYFPDVIFIGEQRVSKEEFDILLLEGYIEEVQHDSFGRFYRLSKTAEERIHELSVIKRPLKKRKRIIAVTQGSFCFA